MRKNMDKYINVNPKELKNHSFNKIFGDLPEEDFEALVNDIKQRGMKTNIDITKNKTIVCGHQRVKACLKLGIKNVNARILDGWTDFEIKEHLIKDNVLRRQLTPFQVVEAGKELKKIYTGREGSNQYKRAGGQVSTAIEGKTRDLVAKDFGISGRTYERYEKIYNHAKNTKRQDLIKLEKQRQITYTQVNRMLQPLDKIIKDPTTKTYTKLTNKLTELEEIITYTQNKINKFTKLEKQNLKDYLKEFQETLFDFYKKLEGEKQ
jgi:hypothetical protein